MVQNHVKRAAKVRQPRPVRASIGRDIKSPGTGTEKNAVGIGGIISQAAYITTVRPQRLPCLGGSKTCHSQQKYPQKQKPQKSQKSQKMDWLSGVHFRHDLSRQRLTRECHEDCASTSYVRTIGSACEAIFR